MRTAALSDSENMKAHPRDARFHRHDLLFDGANGGLEAEPRLRMRLRSNGAVGHHREVLLQDAISVEAQFLI